MLSLMYFHSAQPSVLSEGSSSAYHTVEVPWYSLRTIGPAGWPLPLGYSGLRAAQAFTPALREPVEGCGREHSSAQGSLFA